MAGPEHGLGEGDLQDDLCVRALAAGAALAACREALAEKRVEQVAEAAGEAEVAVAGACSGASHRIGAEHVVAAAPLGVAQGLIGDCDLLEAGLGLRVAGLGIGVQLAGELAVGALQLVFGSRSGHPEQLVEVLGHRHI